MDQVIVRPKGVPANSALAKSEHELFAAISGAFEAFFLQGMILERILLQKEFQDAGFASFNAYMDERQPCGIKKSHAWNLIGAMRVRRVLPTIESTNVDSGSWTEAAIRPLLHKDFGPADHKRLGKKIATRVKHGEKLTSALVKVVCDEDRGVERRKAEKKYQEIAETPTPADILKKCRVELRGWIQALGNVPGDFWLDAETERPGSREELLEVASELVSVLAGAKPARKRV